ncbi:MAG TPA: MFS transporter [Pseudonocardiaceae bacterium]|nr:MFS transporter [Pseudonocardiaceae bacterium]
MPVHEATTEVTSGRSTARVGVALVVLGLAALLAVLDGTVVAVALNPLAAAFGTPLAGVVWVTTGYLLAAASMLPLLGWASARFGARRVFLTGLVLFVAGSALAALAWSAGSLIAFRVVQGFGGGLLEPSSLGLAATLASRDRVGRVLGTMSMIINVAPVLGPIVGGLLLGTGHWQWIFLVNIPFGVVVFAAALAFVPAGPRSPTERPDVRGLVLLTVGFVAVLFALNRSTDAPVTAAVAAAAGIATLAGYVRHALAARTPAFNLRLLRRPGFAAALSVMGCVGLIMYSQLTSLPIFDTGRGAADGLLVSALGVGLLVSMSTGGRVSDRTGPRPLVTAGSVVTAAGLAAFLLWHDDLPLPVLFALFVVIGLSFGLAASPTFTSVYRTLPAAEQPQGTTALFMTVQLAASLGVTLLGLLRAQAGAAWLTVLYGVLVAAALGITALSVALPGRPGPR